MRITLTGSLACCAAICSLANAPVAKASYEFATGSICQLSIPTTDTKFRPKATGARNESTSASNFVICPLQTDAVSNSAFSVVLLAIYSLDGVPRNVTCTAVAGWHGNASLQYSPKTASVSDTGEGHIFLWSAEDFGGVEGDPIAASLGMSVTCNLPPQTAINVIQAG